MIDSTIHTYLVVEMAKRHLSQTLVAAMCGATPQMFNMVIRGVKKSAQLQLKIANLFGFPNWDLLYQAALKFQEKEVFPYYFEIKEHA